MQESLPVRAIVTKSSHGNELFCGGRVDSDSVVEIFLGRAHLHGDCEPLQDLVHSETDAVNTDNLLFGTHAD